MSVIEKAISQMESWADDPAHGYDQRYRWGEYGDYDCSAAVIQAWENAGVPVKSKGATYTGNMLAVFKRCGFEDITNRVNLSTGSGLQRGDVLLNETHHTAMYCGNGYEVEASINENGGITGGQPGDQTGREFLKRRYRNYPWTNILRYTGAGNTASSTIKETTSADASTGGLIDTVREVQIWLNQAYSAGLSTDGLYGTFTKRALTKALQRCVGVDADGIFGAMTYTACRKLDLAKGMTGEAVKILQAFLVCNGYKAAYVDADFGNGTERALKAYQGSHGLAVDGIAAQATFESFCR